MGIERLIAMLLGVAALGLAACGNPWADSAPTRAEIIVSGWALASQVAARPYIYCYRTLGVVDCRKAPEPGQVDRLMGHDGGDFAAAPR